MANGNYGKGPSQARGIIAVVAGIAAFLLTKFVWEQGFWWALLIGVVMFLIILLLWMLFGGQSDPGYGGSTGSSAAAAGSVGSAAAASSAAASAPPMPPAAPVMAQTSASSVRDASVSSAGDVAAPVGLMSNPTPVAPKAAEPVTAKSEKSPKAAKPAVVKSATVKAAKSATVKPAASQPAAKAEKVAKAATKAVVTKAGAKAEKPAKTAVEPVGTPAKPAKAGGPELLKAPRGGKADDLKVIEGIGPALEKLVNGFGVYHFDQIAKWTVKDIAFFDAKMERFSGRITRDKWVAQAKIIGKEGIEAFLERAKTNNY